MRESARMASPVNARPKLPFAGFWIALVIFVVSAIAGIVMVAIAVGTVANAISDFAEIDVPQTAEVRLGSGEYWVFAGTPSDSSISATAVDVTVTAPDGSFVVLTSELGSYDAETGGLSFTSLGRIDVQSAGVYTFETNGPGEATVRVGQLPIGRFVGLLVGGIVIGGLGFLVALILVIVTLVRRSSAKKRVAAASAYPVAGGPTPFPAPTPPPFQPAATPPPPAAPAPPAPTPAPQAPPAPAPQTPAPPAPAPPPPPPAPPAPAPAPPAPAPAPPAPAPAPAAPPAPAPAPQAPPMAPPDPSATPPSGPGTVPPPPPPGGNPGSEPTT